MNPLKPALLFTLSVLITACGGSDGSTPEEPRQQPAPEESGTSTGETEPEPPVARQLPPDPAKVLNAEAPIPPQCYTKTEARFNPCYTCHQNYDDWDRPNYMSDAHLQGVYAFSELGETNHWANLFVDRSEEVAAISDAEILAWINEDNYDPFIRALANDPQWEGPVPRIEDLALGAEAFDEHGFARDGSGWVAFNYKPLPSTFWPTNGSTDDVMIRLPEAFRQNACQQTGSAYSGDVYMANLAALEAAIKQLDRVSTPPIDENQVCADLNNDGQYTVVSEVSRPEYYFGNASDVPVADMLYPQGTQFLHTVRYVGVNEAGDVFVPRRMKEVRYMKKIRMYDNAQLRSLYGNEQQEKRDGNLPRYADQGDQGLSNGFGWLVLGFIEDADGTLRQQTREENKFCMGCHTSIGTTIDQTFAFPRKVTGAAGWGYIDLRGMRDVPNYGGNEGEILQYLRRVGGGNEFRANDEMQARWFNEDGTVKEEAVREASVYELITPSRDRALRLNKAYRVIVEEQSFIYGRDATVEPVDNVYPEIDPEESVPLEPQHRVDDYDIRLRWND
ncbi:hypothetical protein H0Z60_04420 [Ectothiorhodospiraceae bacterium WFHF3C12]|nr:hypothetical protein [Ectothiorhodospiraceae bacterium WFHF3C12]